MEAIEVITLAISLFTLILYVNDNYVDGAK